MEQLEKGQNYFAHSVNPQLLSSVFLGHGRRVAEQERDGRELKWGRERERDMRELKEERERRESFRTPPWPPQ